MNSFLPRLAVICAAFTLAFGCEKAPTAQPGQGKTVSADPTFEVTLVLAGGEAFSRAPQGLTVFESAPPRGEQKRRPNGFDLQADGLVLAGYLPADLAFFPDQHFEQLQGKELRIAPGGGDPTAPSMSKMTLADGKVYRAVSGVATITDVFQSPGKYIGLSGSYTVTLQQIKLGDTEDPNSKGDEPIGEPVEATGKFTAKARAFKYESM